MLSPYDVAQRFTGLREIPGPEHHPLIQYCFSLCDLGLETPDEVPWCSAWLQLPFHVCGLPRSHSALARSWLAIGQTVPLTAARPGWDVAIFKRGADPQPGPENLTAPGHVGLYHDHGGGKIHVHGGNQGDEVCLRPYRENDLLRIVRVT